MGINQIAEMIEDAVNNLRDEFEADSYRQRQGICFTMMIISLKILNIWSVIYWLEIDTMVEERFRMLGSRVETVQDMLDRMDNKVASLDTRFADLEFGLILLKLLHSNSMNTICKKLWELLQIHKAKWTAKSTVFLFLKLHFRT